MVIKTAPKPTPDASLEKALATFSALPGIKKISDRLDAKRAKESQKRKPSGNAKVAVTLRLPQDVAAKYRELWGEDWRGEMQDAVISRLNEPFS